MTAGNAYCHIPTGTIISLEIDYCSVIFYFILFFFHRNVLSVDGIPQVDRNILLTGLFTVTRILIRRESKAFVNSLTRIRP